MTSSGKPYATSGRGVRSKWASHMKQLGEPYATIGRASRHWCLPLHLARACSKTHGSPCHESRPLSGPNIGCRHRMSALGGSVPSIAVFAYLQQQRSEMIAGAGCRHSAHPAALGTSRGTCPRQSAGCRHSADRPLAPRALSLAPVAPLSPPTPPTSLAPSAPLASLAPPTPPAALAARTP